MLFRSIASAIGKPLHVHKMTATCRRLSFARLCIEVNAEFELPNELDIEFTDPISGEVNQITLKVEYQWNPVRCAKCKKFGHNCVTLPKAVKPQAQACRPSSSHSKKKFEEGVWMVVSKGKTVVDLDQECGPYSNAKMEPSVMIDDEGNGKLLDSGHIRIDSEGISSDINEHSSLVGAGNLASSPNLGEKMTAAASSGGDSLVTSIGGVQHYATKVHGGKLKEINQFAILDNIDGDIAGVGENVDTFGGDTQQSLEAMGSIGEALNHSSSTLIPGQVSGQGKYLKNDHQSSSGKYLSPPDVLNVS